MAMTGRERAKFALGNRADCISAKRGMIKKVKRYVYKKIRRADKKDLDEVQREA